VVPSDDHHLRLVARSRVVRAVPSDDHDLELLLPLVREHKQRYPSLYCREPDCPYRLGLEHSSGYCPRHEGRKRPGKRSPPTAAEKERDKERTRWRLEQQKTSFWGPPGRGA
jgi:hypothetical protein